VLVSSEFPGFHPTHEFAVWSGGPVGSAILWHRLAGPGGFRYPGGPGCLAAKEVRVWQLRLGEPCPTGADHPDGQSPGDEKPAQKLQNSHPICCLVALGPRPASRLPGQAIRLLSFAL